MAENGISADKAQSVMDSMSSAKEKLKDLQSGFRDEDKKL